MKLKVFALAVALFLSGCSYSLSDIKEARTACSGYGGEFSVGTGTTGIVISAYCKIDGIRYYYHRGQQDFLGGEVVK